MKPLSDIRATLALASLALVFATGAATANELAASLVTGGVNVHDADETLEHFTARDPQGGLWLVLPDGTRFELVTSIDDPAIVNRGDGAFHPFEANEVRAALAEVRYPLKGVDAEIFILPFPRRGGLESAAGEGLILLSPGVRPITRERQHAELVHELGHVVQHVLLPDHDASGWNVYRRLRGIEDRDTYADHGPHANRPHEIFAEDFRYLFGGATARYSGTIENHVLALPDQVPGLDAFMLGLGETGGELAFTAFPNPAPQGLRFVRRGGAAVELDLFDVTGRRIETLTPTVNGTTVEWRWNRQDASGRRIGPGVVFARLRDSRGTTARVTLLP